MHHQSVCRSCSRNDCFTFTFVTGVMATFECEYYSQRHCNSGVGQCSGTDMCTAAEPGKRTHCYVLWNSSSDVAEVILKGCWLDAPECYNRSLCVATRQETPGIFFCCCERPFCNGNFSVSPDAVLLVSSTRLPAGLYFL